MIFDKLERMENFTLQERRIAKYILENPINIKDLSTEELAKVTFSSQSTVVRLCKKLETKGYHDFQLKLSTEYLEAARVRDILKDEPITPESTNKDIIEIISKMYDSAITNTKLMIDNNVMTRVTNRLKKADKIDFYGYGISYNLAQQASFKLMALGIESMAYDGINEHYIETIKNYSRRVAILISFTGKNTSIIQIAKYLKRHNIYIVGISGYRTTELLEVCNELIQIDTKKLVLSMEAITAVISTQYILDIFFSVLLASNYEENIKASLKVFNNPFNKI